MINKIQLFSFSDYSVCLVAGVGGKLSRLVYLAPHTPGYQSKFILLILLILNYLYVKMYQLKASFKSDSAVFFVALFRILSYRDGWWEQAIQASLSCPPPPPNHMGIKVK